MKKIAFEIKGLSPLKMDKWNEYGANPKTKEEYVKLAEDKCYRDEKGNLCIESKAIKACIREAAAELSGRKRKGVIRQIQAGLFIEPFNLSLNKKSHDGIINDVVTRKNGKAITRVVSFRPLVKDWSCKGQFIIDEGLSFDFLKQAFDYAGLYFGLLGHRPEFGRFEVVNFKEV